MKALLVAINAKYIHSNLAVYSLQAYAKKYSKEIELAEYTINNQTDYILQEIYKKKPDFIGFSCYIWNISIIEEIAKEIKKLLPAAKIWFGGPEVSYDVEETLKSNTFLDGIMYGEGEATFLELMDYYMENQTGLEYIKGIAYRDNAKKLNILLHEGPKDKLEEAEQIKGKTEETEQIKVNPERQPMSLSEIPFPYSDLKKFENKIIYYETSRGCPYSCSYCLSSVDKKVRFRDIELVKKELKLFIEQKIPQVKFIDRTFNCNRKHAMEIWKFIDKNDNGITNYHFEISADLLTEEELSLLKTFRKGLIQFEIGVQSTNTETITAINRKMDFDKLSYVVKELSSYGNIHLHLDLIAGLPYENYESFRSSFYDVYKLKPEQLQLGFLKVLKGSPIYRKRAGQEIIYKDKAPYEVLYTNWLNYDEVLRLKQVEEMAEVYYNSGQFTHSILYLELFFENPFDLYAQLGTYYEKNGLFDKNHARISRYYILRNFYKEFLEQGDSEEDEKKAREEAFDELLIYDLYLRENLKSRPEFGKSDADYKQLYWNFYEREKTEHKYLIGYEQYNPKQIGRMVHIEHFNYLIPELIKGGEVFKKENFIVFDYQERNPLNQEARTVLFLKDEFINYAF